MKGKKNKKNIMVGALILAVVASVIIAVILACRGGLSDEYFVSDGTKYVLTEEVDELTTEEYSPIKIHRVYMYSDNKITNLKAYYEYIDEDSAKLAYEYYEPYKGKIYKDVTVEGRYVILEPNESEYENMTVEDIKQQIDSMTSEVDSEQGEGGEAVEEEIVEDVENNF